MSGEIPKGSELEKKLIIYFKFDNEHRGAFLVSVTQGESFLANAIATHFEPNDKEKNSVFTSLVLTEISFDKKIKIFSHLLQSYYSEILKKFPTIENDLKSVHKFRNKMAHRAIDSRVEFVMKYAGQKLSLQYHKDGKERYDIITKKDFEEKIRLAQGVTSDLADIEEMITDIQKSKSNP